MSACSPRDAAAHARDTIHRTPTFAAIEAVFATFPTVLDGPLTHSRVFVCAMAVAALGGRARMAVPAAPALRRALTQLDPRGPLLALSARLVCELGDLDDGPETELFGADFLRGVERMDAERMS